MCFQDYFLDLANVKITSSENISREANDRGFECLLISDCCGATDQGNHDSSLKIVKMHRTLLKDHVGIVEISIIFVLKH